MSFLITQSNYLGICVVDNLHWTLLKTNLVKVDFCFILLFKENRDVCQQITFCLFQYKSLYKNSQSTMKSYKEQHYSNNKK